jgi:hypothetical protein
MAGRHMSHDTYSALVIALCEVIQLPDARDVLQRGAIEVEGFEVLMAHYDNDPTAMYLTFHFGVVTAGRTLTVFRLMLESNLTVYAQDQAQLGINPDTNGIVLIVRVPMSEDIDGAWLADTLAHYAQHGRYWRDSILASNDESFSAICAGDYFWLKA